ncbi:dCTP deaminase [Candidatus Uhrbacteria bacterium CG10_big_fil_rev_8_21_14_0_10_50_16]|uniref:dCTP deaminase, dUMP-forming n=1 Tax=Candidatus Uhrbacteria bacterium CG10_big_fil_rev_8_21_14_0_10_50_16 TaxID=1975039 RepID=A0A2H0RMF9_9BACT|nr:MAG: dCTP deaminase [Candidatus Uhrbacteria bacterium CG10_big_fil_rev_8_21_14_0_10_50_16]
MILSDRDIQKAMEAGDISVEPYHEKMMQPASIDLRLDKHFLIFDTNANFVIDPKKPIDPMMKEIVIDEDTPFVLHPGEFALAMIHETTGVSDKYVGRLEGKSSIGRMGLLIHVTAGFLDPGNCLKMTLELHNVANLPILLYYKMPIAQIAFEKISSPSIRSYSKDNAHALNSKYVGDMKPKASQMWKNFLTEEELEKLRDT